MWSTIHWNLHTLFRYALVYRLISALVVTTYFNPDEFWQNQEVATRLVYGTGNLTWEWHPFAQIRGFFHPGITAFLYWILKTTRLDFPWLIAWSPRLLQAVLTSISDVCVYRLALRWSHFHPQISKWAMFLYYTNWFTFYCSSRPFSNSAEAALFTIALYYFPFSGRSWCPAEHLCITIPNTNSITHAISQVCGITLGPSVSHDLQIHPGSHAAPLQESEHSGSEVESSTSDYVRRTRKPNIRWRRSKVVASGDKAPVEAGHLDPATQLHVFASPTSADDVSDAASTPVAKPQTEPIKPHDRGQDVVLESHTLCFIALALCVVVRPASAGYIFFLLLPLFRNTLIGTSREVSAARYIFKQLVVITFITVLVSTLFDSVIYAILSPEPVQLRRFFTFIPWNFFRMNSLYDIGALYGAHSWHWNFTQGFPAILAAALPLCFLGSLADIFALVLTETNTIEKQVKKISRAPTLIVLLILTIYSFQSHKEFRFLLPALPLALFPAARFATRLHVALKNHTVWYAYLAFIVVTFIGMTTYFGCIHQRGPITAVEYVARHTNAASAAPTGVLFFMPCHATPYLSFFQGSKYSVDLTAYVNEHSVPPYRPDVVLHTFDCSPHFGPKDWNTTRATRVASHDWKLIGNGYNPDAESNRLTSLLQANDAPGLAALLHDSLRRLEATLPENHVTYVITYGNRMASGQILQSIFEKSNFVSVYKSINHLNVLDLAPVFNSVSTSTHLDDPEAWVEVYQRTIPSTHVPTNSTK